MSIFEHPDQARLSISIAAAIISLIGMGISIIFSLRRARRTKQALAIQSFNVDQRYKERLLTWASTSMDSISYAYILCDTDPAQTSDFFDRRNQSRAQLTSLIDQGRWFFVNDMKDGYGTWKHSAFQGIAPEIIEILKDCYGIVDGLNYREQANNRDQIRLIVDLKKRFASRIQEYVDPEKTLESLDTIRDNFGVQ